MKITKNISALIVIILTINLLCSCSTKTDTSSADTYLSMAEDFVAQGNHSAAIDILQKGFSETKDERIAVMIAEITSGASSTDQSASTTPNSSKTDSTSTPTTPTIAENTSITKATTSATDTPASHSYAGTFAEQNIGWQDGGMIADIQLIENTIVITLSYTQGAPASRIAEVKIAKPLSEIKNDILVGTFEDDGWGNKGTVEFKFIEADAIQCKLSGIVSGSAAMWGFYEDQFTLYRNSNAHSSMSYTMEDYYAIHPEERPTTAPTYDTSKASGILAQAGLTEQDFRNICTYINSKYYDNNEYVYAAGRQYYTEHPEENTLLDNYTEDWVSYQSLGTNSPHYDQYTKYDLQNSNSLDDYLNRKIYGPKGASILGKQSEEYFKAMQEYPADYVNKPFLLKDFRVESIYDYTYSLNNYVLYDTIVRIVDYRDDVNYPSILNKTYYDMYVIFLGTQGSDTLVFALISVEKSE